MTYELLVDAAVKQEENRFENIIQDDDIVRGEDFELELKFVNVGDEVFPGGRVYNIELLFENTRTEADEFEVPSLKPKNGNTTDYDQFTKNTQFHAVETGRVGLEIDIQSEDQIRVDFVDEEGDTISGWINTFYVVNREMMMILEHLKNDSD